MAAYAKGDLVRLRLQPKIAGQVVAEEEWGARFGVRLYGGIDVEWFEAEELEFYPVREAKAQTADVINFTRAREMRANSKTKGAA